MTTPTLEPTTLTADDVTCTLTPSPRSPWLWHGTLSGALVGRVTVWGDGRTWEASHFALCRRSPFGMLPHAPRGQVTSASATVARAAGKLVDLLAADLQEA